MDVIIVDDERLARSEMKRLLGAHSEVSVVGEAANVDEAEEVLAETDPDLMFLDVQMPEATGFDLLERLDAVPEVVFVTAYNEYAIKAFEKNALDYLVKPVEPHRLEEALDRAGAALRVAKKRQSQPDDALTPNDKVFVKDGKRCWFLRVGDVYLFESAGNYTQLHFDDEAPLINRSLNYLEDRLGADRFFRASRQHIVNLGFVEDVKPRFQGKLTLVLRDGTEVEMSRRRSRAFRDRMEL
ncbi:MAG: response regulator [Bacteroidetes bacterium]|jgi:two-component system LytT family response regulator|nr:response regulator [Bacteroidota bacterium]